VSEFDTNFKTLLLSFLLRTVGGGGGCGLPEFSV